MKLEARNLLISRIVDRRDGVEDWDELEALADADVWRQVGLALRDDAWLRRGVGEYVECARAMAAPGRAGAVAPSARHRNYLIGALSLILILIVIGMIHGPTERPEVASIDEPAVTSAGEHEARVLRQFAPILIERRPTPDGQGIEVIYLRRVLESLVVDSTLRLGRDESGQLTASAAEPASFQLVSSF